MKSPRRFLQHLPLLSIGLLTCAPPIARGTDHLALLGTYTGGDNRGIHLVRLDAETGALSAPELVAELAHPEFLALHPGGRVIYALTRVSGDDGTTSGAVASLAVDHDSGRLTLLNIQVARAGSLTHLAVDATGRILVAASYGGAYVASFPIEPDGRLGPRASLITHEGKLGPYSRRQDAPHPHSVTISPDNRFAFVADLGLDRVFAYRPGLADGTIAAHQAGDITMAPGAGPRHTKFSPDGATFYVLNELDCTITSCRYDTVRGVAEPFDNVPTLADDSSETNTTSEIRAHPNGRFVYAANRGHDSIAVFARDEQSGALARVEVVPCGGKRPRNFNLTPDGNWLLCGHQDSNTVTSFRIDPDTGRLAMGHTVATPTPVCVLFLR